MTFFAWQFKYVQIIAMNIFIISIMLIWCYLDLKLQLMAHETYLINGGSCGLMDFTFWWAFQYGLSIAVLPASASSNSSPLISTGGSVCKAVKSTSLQTSQMVPTLVLITAVTWFTACNIIWLPSHITKITTNWIGQLIVIIFRMRKCWNVKNELFSKRCSLLESHICIIDRILRFDN